MLGKFRLRMVLASGAMVIVATTLGAGDHGRTHRLESGQTLWSVAYAYGVRVEDLMSLNDIADPTVVPAGTALVLPQMARPRPVPPPSRTDLSFDWPLRGQLTSAYGRRRGKPHTGIDIAATRGTIVVAAADGRVVRAGGWWGRYGQVVLIEHPDGRQTLYAHLARCYIRPNQEVRRGQAIAAVGETGNATGPHLHFEIWEAERTVNPLLHLVAR